MRLLLLSTVLLCSCSSCSEFKPPADSLARFAHSINASQEAYTAACDPFPPEGTAADVCRAAYKVLQSERDVYEALQDASDAGEE